MGPQKRVGHNCVPPVFRCDVAMAGVSLVPSLVMRSATNKRHVDIVFAGTFAAWRLGTLQARALPFARELTARGIRCAIVTVPWDMPSESGVVDTVSKVEIVNTAATGVLSFPVAVSQMSRQIRALRPRAVHVYKPKGFGGLAGRILSHHAPLIIDSDDWEGDGGWNQHGGYSVFQRRLFDWQERTLLRSATAVTAASHLLRRRALALRDSPSDSVAWVPNGLDKGWAQRISSARSDLPGSDLNTSTIVLYSRFAEFPDDWLPRYLTRLSAVLPRSARSTVLTVGESAQFRSGFGNLDLHQLGYVAYERLPEILGRADIAIFPYTDSLIARSKNSVKLLELLAAGCAVIAPAIGDVPAVASDAACLIESSEPEAFAEASLKLHRSPQLVRRLSSAAQDRVVDHFTVAAITDRLIDSYRDAGVLPSCSTS